MAFSLIMVKHLYVDSCSFFLYLQISNFVFDLYGSCSCMMCFESRAGGNYV